MALRLQQIHPSLVHFPLALVPLAIGFDLVGRLTGSRTAMEAARRMMPVAAASAIATGVAGLIAQEAVRPYGRAHDILVTHRNLNVALIAATTVMAARRYRTRRPGIGYLLAGVAGVAAMNFTAYLGGMMVYEHGLGVRPAGGLEESASPEIRRGELGRAGRVGMRNASRGIGHALLHLARGKIAPALRH